MGRTEDGIGLWSESGYCLNTENEGALITSERGGGRVKFWTDEVPELDKGITR